MKENQPVEVETIDKYLKYTFSDFKKEEENLRAQGLLSIYRTTV